MATAPHRLQHRDFARPAEGRMVAGVAAGFADAFRIDANVVRCGFVVLTIASGVGILLYAACWLVVPERAGGRPAAGRDVDVDVVSTAAFGAVVLGVLLAVRALAFWPGDVIVWPLAATIAGLALLAMRTTPTGARIDVGSWPLLGRLPPDAAAALGVLVGTRRGALARVIAGAACVVIGIVAFIITVDSWSALRSAVVAMTAVLVGIALVIGPALVRLGHALADERRERIRADERAEVAAHLHDSVLQTLALVQRRANEPREVVRLARLQERELRAWLLTGGAPPTAESLGVALEELASEIERERGVPVEVVRVRDCAVDGMDALLLAAREAVLNATKHSGAETVSVYLEVEPDKATVFVRDRGRGFDTGNVPDDRGGISNSIVGRMTRAGGSAQVRSTPGEGTEVELQLPRSAA